MYFVSGIKSHDRCAKREGRARRSLVGEFEKVDRAHRGLRWLHGLPGGLTVDTTARRPAGCTGHEVTAAAGQTHENPPFIPLTPVPTHPLKL